MNPPVNANLILSVKASLILWNKYLIYRLPDWRRNIVHVIFQQVRIKNFNIWLIERLNFLQYNINVSIFLMC